MPVSEELKSGKIVFIKDATYLVGPSINGGNCLDILGSVKQEILPPDSINQATIDMTVKRAGLEVYDLPPRTKEFKVEKVLEVTKFNSYSQSGPSWWLILSDEAGVLYKMAVVFFSENGGGQDDQAIAVFQFEGKEYPLTYYSFVSRDDITGDDLYKFQLGADGIDVKTPFLSYEEVVSLIKKDHAVTPIYQGGDKAWFKRPNSAGQRECGTLSLYDINTRRYHDTDIWDCSVIDIDKSKPFYVNYCGEIDCLFGMEAVQVVNLNTKRVKDIFSLPLSVNGETLMKECHTNIHGGSSCVADISITDDSRLRIGIYSKEKQINYSADYSNTKIRDEYIDLVELR